MPTLQAAIISITFYKLTDLLHQKICSKFHFGSGDIPDTPTVHSGALYSTSASDGHHD